MQYESYMNLYLLGMLFNELRFLGIQAARVLRIQGKLLVQIVCASLVQDEINSTNGMHS